MASRGLYAIRMGYLIEKPVHSNNRRVIDYASMFHDDFADIYLSARCKFFLGCTAGLFCVAQCFDVPIAAANFAPLGTVPLRAQDIFIPKKYWSVKENRFLSFPEIIAMGADTWFNARKFAAAGIEFKESTAADMPITAFMRVNRLGKTERTFLRSTSSSPHMSSSRAVPYTRV